MKANGIKILVNAIQPDLEISIDAVILALANLIKDNNQYKSDIITHNILDVLTRVSENFREEIYSSISYFLMGLANNEYKFRISHLAQIVYLLERIIVCKITEVQVYCLWTIAEITSIAEHVPVIIQSDLIKNTVDFLKCGEMKLISPAFRIIKQIGAGNFTAMKYLEFEEWHPEATTKYEPAKTPKESLDFDDLLSIMSDELLIKHSLIKTRASSTLFNLINWDNEAKLKTISMGIFRIIFKIFEIDDDDIFQTKILEVCVNLLEIFENKQYSNPIAILFIQTGCFDGLKNLCKRMASIKQLCNKIGQRFFGVNDILNDVPMVIKELS